MPQKPTYEELEKRVKQLEHFESERSQIESALKEANNTLQQMLDGTNDVIAFQKPDHTILRYNRAGYELIGLTPEEVIGKKCYELFGWKKECEKCATKKALESKKIETVEKYYPKLDKYFKLTANPVPGEEGDIDYIIEQLTDITMRKQAEENLRKSEERYADTISNVNDIIWRYEVDARGEFVGSYISPAADRLLGLSDGEIGHSIDKFFNHVFPEDLPAVKDALGSALAAAGEKKYFEYRMRKSDGTIIWVNSHGSAKLQPNGNIIAFGVTTDVTDRKQMEQVLEKQMISLTRPLDDPEGITFDDLFNIEDIQSLQDKFAEATGVASIITKTDGTPITRPSNFCRLCSDIIRKTEKGRQNCYKSDAVIGRQNPDGPTIQHCLSGGLWDAGAAISVGGKHIANWLIGQVRDETQTDEKMKAYAREIGADEQAVIEAFHEVTPMSHKKFEVISQTLFTLADQLSSTAYQNIQQARFISEKKRSDKEKEKLEARLRQAQKMEAIGRLAGGVAHDFNNMLSVILGNTELALDEEGLTEEISSNLNEIMKAAQRSAEVTRQLLAFARKQTIAPRILDLNKTIQNSFKMLQRLIDENIELILKPDEKIWPIHMDPTQIDQILTNLCINARDAVSGAGKIIIETSNEYLDETYCSGSSDLAPGSYVKLSFSDNGCGMDRETVNNMFEPFFTTKSIDKGTGLGLATVYGIVKQNNGLITVYSELERGTTFEIYLPRFETGEGQVNEKISISPHLHGSETILLVEDEPSILKTAKRMLERLDYTVLAAVTPGEAINLARDHEKEIHLLMTDIVMPEMNGKELAGILLSTYPDLKSLFMSGYTSDVIAHHGTLDEGVDFIQKPFSIHELSVKVREALGK